MIDVRNKQYCTVLNCVAGEDLEQGQLVKLSADATGTVLVATAADAADDFGVWGPLMAYWINDRSTAVQYSGGEDGLSFPVAGASDPDATHYIPKGARMLAIGGIGVAEVRVFPESLHESLQSSLPNVGTTLGVSSTNAKLCDASDASAIPDVVIARVTEKDAVSITVILGHEVAGVSGGGD